MDGSGLGGSCPDSQGNNNQGQGHNRGMSGPNTPLTPSSNANDSLPPRYPGHNNSSSGAGPQTPHTPNPTNPFTVPSPSPAGSNNQCQQQSSNQNNMAGPHTPLAPTEKARYPGPSPGQQQQQGPRTPVSTSIDGSSGGMPRTPGSINMDMMGGGGGGGGGNRYPGSSPQMPGGPASVGAPGFNQNSGGPMMTGQGPASYPTGPGGPGMKMPSSPFPDLSSPRMGGGMGDMGELQWQLPWSTFRHTIEPWRHTQQQHGSVADLIRAGQQQNANSFRSYLFDGPNVAAIDESSRARTAHVFDASTFHDDDGRTQRNDGARWNDGRYGTRWNGRTRWTNDGPI